MISDKTTHLLFSLLLLINFNVQAPKRHHHTHQRAFAENSSPYHINYENQNFKKNKRIYPAQETMKSIIFKNVQQASFMLVVTTTLVYGSIMLDQSNNKS